MSGIDLAFWTLAVIAIVSGWRVFRTDSMVRSAFLLLLSFVAVGLILLLLRAPYLGMATIFMMGVEMMVMALFMVMFMMDPAGLNPMNMVHQERFAIVAGVLAFAGLAAAVWLTDLPQHPLAAGRPVIRKLGLELLGRSMLIFETAGVTLLATMIGTVVLSSRSGRFGPADAGSLPPPLTPDGIPAGRMPESHSGGHGGHAPAAASPTAGEPAHGHANEQPEHHA
ncbi:NADH-quinone oxidoreductase subunit J [Dyella sp. KRB-257]|uniref:NADH-quinone oxidoreductase subunit J family protein n=1 Tax=Dyella sp. KRB-257 TaxID=3400915 RepID=UPI003C05418A